MVVSNAFAVELGSRDGATFISKVEAEVVKIVGKYSTKTEMTKILEIWDDNIRLNRVFEMNELEYGPYPKDAKRKEKRKIHVLL